MFSDLTNLQRWLYGGHCLWEVFQTFCDFYLAGGVAVLTLALFQGHRYVRIITCKGVWLLHNIKKIKHSMLCVTGVYLRDVNVSHPRVCSAVRTVCVFCVSFFSSCRKVHKYYTSKGIFCGILMLILCICFTRWSAFFAKV